ncbi:MAG: IS110 family transposase [Acidobacteriota bacterium]|nr:IS110 family transposase [Acidobacteriota bacterium]
MDSKKYIGMDVHKESISIAVMNGAGKIVMEGVIETKASMILQCIDGLRGDLQVTFEEGTSAAWLWFVSWRSLRLKPFTRPPQSNRRLIRESTERKESQIG